MEDIPVFPEYYRLTEQMTDEECYHFRMAIVENVVCNYGNADYHIAHINRKHQGNVMKYLEDIDKYYAEGGADG